ncbi:GH116 family glycosyl-hydrolase [Wenyingzhuangia sp. 2_MG-2023]|uniref:GH116 family glycosyl-hydrolase n=1 Tax=Wenyingzhuangia sp. 2_MG-2023 TaxID=3062639 RepID=UPI0026E336F4|nr:GH116 family glycosyl-hydrolase [Wenyingzhuangia sp. 2_MG-2023]MDO6737633.1 GH116 family glycosyl-hydrolase [Wenyingzhuangia sp. 2_MG-2023]
MKKSTLLYFLILFSGAIGTSNAQKQNTWPVLKSYDQNHLDRIAMPIGGIGTGTVSMSGYGALIDWEVMSRPAKGYNPIYAGVEVINRAPFFSIYLKEENKEAQALLLEGPVPIRFDEGYYGSTAPNHGLPRFKEAIFQTAYPFGQVLLSDQDLPVEVTVGAFNPLIPGNIEDSSLPMAVLSYKVKNTSSKPITISLAGNIPNFIGFDGKEGKAYQNINTYKEENGLKGIHYTASEEIDKESMQWGTFSMMTNSKEEISYRTAWKPGEWGNSTLEFWDDYTDDGLLEERTSDQKNNMGSLAVKTTLAPNEEKDIRFFITWNFPNRSAWRNDKENVGNFYATQFKDSWEVAQKHVARIPELEQKTKTFVNAFINSDTPEIIKEAALFNLAHFRTQLAFKTNSGYYLGWEGIKDNEGSGDGTCTHVWNYEQTIPFLFGEVAKNMREVEFKYATNEQGLMSYRIHLPLKTKGTNFGLAAADGQMGSIMKYYREWQLSGDDEFLKENWGNVKKALEFCWIPNGWDPDKDGVMEGSQHNTMDVEYYGPNPQMGFWYLGALRATEEMANYLGDKKLAKTCESLYNNGSKWMDKNLFNGEYYVQEIVPPMHLDSIAKGLIRVKKRLIADDPQYQLGEGVLVDQLVGQVMAHILDLGYLADKNNIKKTNESVLKYNYREDLMKHPNFMRSYAYGHESALLMAAYPGKRPKQPFPYYTEVMTGFEHTAAVSMLYEGQEKEALKTIQDIRNRYDGKKRNPFNEAEYGHHYARSMMAWAGVLANSGFHYSGVEKSMTFTSKSGTYFWSNGYSWGTCKVENKAAVLTVLSGQLELTSFSLEGVGTKKMKNKIMNSSNTLKIKL